MKNKYPKIPEIDWKTTYQACGDAYTHMKQMVPGNLNDIINHAWEINKMIRNINEIVEEYDKE